MRRIPCCILLGLAGFLPAQEPAVSGQAIYAEHCASCHGKDGEGNPDEVDEPLYGERTLESLARYIDRKMPEGEPELLDAAESQRVADYIYGTFYSAEARAKRQPLPEAAFARLTNRQFRESVADLLGSFGKPTQPGEGRGLRAQYFDSDGMNKKARKALEREDRALAFDFGEGPPLEGMKADQFSIAWEGSLLAPATGWYEFKVATPNGARLYLNGDQQEGDGNFRDDSGAKRQPAFIDSWVSSGAEVREKTARMFLLGGRAYPIRLDYFKYKDKRGMVRLEWKSPRGEWEVLRAPYLSPSRAVRVGVVSTRFPADDASEGYERGTGISKDWHEATTKAAIEVANQVVSRLPHLSRVPDNDPERARKLKSFIATFAERAFRRPLDEETRRLYVDRAFADGTPPDRAVKRAVILILKSPRFLYPELGAEKDAFTVATRLALAAWDSLPDRELFEAAKAGRLGSHDQVLAQSRRLMADPRAKAKANEFFQRWLKLDAEGDLRKDPEAFPEFDAELVADLRRSLELFVERVVWSEKSDYRELLQADYLLFNDRLAKFYGVQVPEGGGFQPVKFDATQRAGVITHPYVLARLAHPDATSPIHRGVFVTRNLLGGLLKPPPEAIAFENHKFDPKMTMREKVAELTRDANCMTCHETINPLGFTLENFDAVGRYRTTEGDRAIDPEADYHTLEGETLRLRGPRDLADHAATSAGARRGFIRQLLQYELKQNPAVYGHDTLTRLENSFTKSGQNVRNLLVEITAMAARHGIPDPDQARR
ncbi:cytochrome c [Haloferula helveola]|uniref:Cytochrome c n=1 Tax=Haloferula helveola TaxID=490095 RepID=A0ABN6H1P9_9BACT|nr:cytochrome c [Haloferula helveola]